MLRWLGLSTETQVHIVAPGLDITIAGEPRRVRHMLRVITDELGDPGSEVEPTRSRAAPPLPRTSQVVRPSELDETDSPYALPGSDPPAERTYEIPGRQADRIRRGLKASPAPHGVVTRAPSLGFAPFEEPTVLPVPDSDPDGVFEQTPVDSDEPDPERTAVELDPRVEASKAQALVEITDGRVPTIDDETSPRPLRYKDDK